MRLRNLLTFSAAIVSVFATASVADAGTVQTWLDSKGGCQPGPLQLMGVVRPGDRVFLGRSAEDWTDDDVDEFVTVYSGCVRQHAVFALGTVNPSPAKIDAHITKVVDRLKRYFIEPARTQASAERARREAQRRLTQEQALREQDRLAKQARGDREAAAEARQIAEDRSRRERERLQEQSQHEQERLQEQAGRDREAAEEASRLAEVEQAKIAEVAREAEAARRARQSAEQRLAEVRARLGAEVKARRDTEAQAQAAERPQQELKKGTDGSKLTIAENLYKGTIKGDAVIGCDRELFDRSISIANSGDKDAYARLMIKGLTTGSCIRFRNGQTVFIEERTFLGARCIRPEGSANSCVWIVREEMER